MLAWIVLLTTAVIGLLITIRSEADVAQSLPAVPVALAVIAALCLLYLFTFRSQTDDAPSGSRRLLRFAALLAFAAAAVPVIRTYGGPSLLAGLPQIGKAVQPPSPVSGRVAVRIRRGDDSRFAAYGLVNGTPLRFVIDTGAAAVMLRSTDAEAAGVDIRGLAFDTPIQTANGTTYAAAVQLRSIGVGAISVGDVEAFVARPGTLNEPLLGMSFLRRLSSYQLSGDFLTLHQ